MRYNKFFKNSKIRKSFYFRGLMKGCHTLFANKAATLFVGTSQDSTKELSDLSYNRATNSFTLANKFNRAGAHIEKTRKKKARVLQNIYLK